MLEDGVILVVGGGPAGASAAVALRQLGHPVVVLERTRFPRPHIGESLPPKILPLLSVLGVGAEVEAAGFARMRGTTVDLGAEQRTHDFDPEGGRLGLQVDRARFDQLLLERAAQLGAEVRFERAAQELVLDGQGQVRGVRVRSGGQVEELAAGMVIDATGAASILARAFGGRRRETTRTVALTAYFRGGALPAAFPPENTLFEMTPDGWLWSVLLADGRRNVTVGLDPASLKGREVERVYAARLEASRLLPELLRGGRRESGVEVHDATTARAEVAARRGLVAVGDAASVIDPLTSQGVYKAIHSGLLAAAVVHTIHLRPADEALALGHYREEQARSFEKYSEVALSFYRGSPFVDRPFWEERTRPDAEPGAVDPARLAEKSARRARLLERVRGPGGAALPIRVRASLEIASLPCVERSQVVLRPAWVSREAPRFRLFGDSAGLDLAALTPLLDGRPLERVFEAYAESSGRGRSAEEGKRIFQGLLALAEEGLLEEALTAGV